MPLWGVSDAAETKPTYLTDAQKNKHMQPLKVGLQSSWIVDNSNTSKQNQKF